MITLFFVSFITIYAKKSNPKFIRIVSYFPVQISLAQIGIGSTSKVFGVDFRARNRFISIRNAKIPSCVVMLCLLFIQIRFPAVGCGGSKTSSGGVPRRD